METVTKEECRKALNISKLTFLKAIYLNELRADSNGNIRIDNMLAFADKRKINRESVIIRMLYKKGSIEKRKGVYTKCEKMQNEY